MTDEQKLPQLIEDEPLIPQKQVIVMRTDLTMRKGKMIAQGAHASMLFLIQAAFGAKGGLAQWTRQCEWLEGGMTKVCVRVESETELLDIECRAISAGLTVYLVTDSGRTEFNGVPTKTCLAIGPNFSEDIDKITGGLKLL